jgi:hypothetical protein
MVDERRLSDTLRDQITQFSDRIAIGLKKPQRKFIFQMLFGMMGAKDIKLSNIARSLHEAVDLIKTENRLSRQTKTEGLGQCVTEALIKNGGGYVKQDTVLAVDVSDLTKQYARKMEFLTWVRDGSDAGKRTQGYWLLGVVGANVDGEQLIPLRMDLYSQAADDFASENTQILDAVASVQSVIPGRGIWAIDRGGDRRRLLDGLLRHQCHFVTRLVGDRNLRPRNGQLRRAKALAAELRCPDEAEFETEDQGSRKHYRVRIGSCRVKLPWRDETFTLVVVRGFGKKPMMLLTNATGKTARAIVEIYLTRWKIEESYRFLKSGYQVEDIRVRSYVGLQNTVALLLAVFHFLALVLGERFQLSVLLKKVLERARRFFQVAGFKFYAMADGIGRILYRTGISPPPKTTDKDTSQMTLSFC